MREAVGTGVFEGGEEGTGGAEGLVAERTGTKEGGDVD